MAALRKLPYLPLYVQDFTGDERLTGCSPAAVGVYIFLLCFLHKSESYGMLLLRQKDKLTETECSELKKLIESKIESKIIPFAKRLQRNMPFELHEIAAGLNELEEEGVITIDGETLYQRRMVKDGEISEKRSINGTLGGRPTKCESTTKTKTKSKTKSKTESKNTNKNEANSENENEYVCIDKKDIKEGVIGGENENTATEKKIRKFTPPTYEEVEEYCRERENGIDANEFVDFYTTNGWKQKGGNPVKDWKACVRTWERNGIKPRNYGTRTTEQESATAPGRPSAVQRDAEKPRTRRSTI